MRLVSLFVCLYFVARSSARYSVASLDWKKKSSNAIGIQKKYSVSMYTVSFNRVLWPLFDFDIEEFIASAGEFWTRKSNSWTKFDKKKCLTLMIFSSNFVRNTKALLSNHKTKELFNFVPAAGRVLQKNYRWILLIDLNFWNPFVASCENLDFSLNLAKIEKMLTIMCFVC